MLSVLTCVSPPATPLSRVKRLTEPMLSRATALVRRQTATGHKDMTNRDMAHRDTLNLNSLSHNQTPPGQPEADGDKSDIIRKEKARFTPGFFMSLWPAPSRRVHRQGASRRVSG